jgi:hypothetical protein
MRRSLLAALLAGIALSVACDNSDGGDTATGPTTVTLTTETFTGSVDPMGSKFHPFSVAQAGEVDITLTAAGPPSTIFMGLAIGVLSADAASCTLDSRFTVVVQAGTTPQIPVSAGTGKYCVQIFDAGNQVATINYTITVAHP